MMVIAGLVAVSPATAARITAEKVGNKIKVTINNRFFTSYIFEDDEKYPFFFPVNGPVSGGSVTSMRSSSDPHHSSLFFACSLVNGGNYWQEGLDRGKITSVNAQIVKQGGDTVIITDECIWSRPGVLAPIKDSRKFTITSPSATLYQIDVEISMMMLMDITIPTSNHSLFSVRMAADLSVRNGATMVNAEGATNEKATFGVRSPWMDYYGKRGATIEGIAILQHPSDPWYPSQWFTRDYGFMTPSPMYFPENGKETTFAKGTVLDLRYRVLVHAGDVKEAKIAEEFEKYKSVKF
jgi:hypothetical protein